MTTTTATAHDRSLTGVFLSRGELMTALAETIDFALGEPVPHHLRTAALASRMALAMGSVNPRQVLYAALMHDLGAAGASPPPHRVRLVEQSNLPALGCHTFVGAQVVGNVPGLFGVAQIILDHHEWANGHGYPRGKTGREILTEAQIIRFADTCDMVLREQAWPELVPLVHAVRGWTEGQVEPAVADAGIEVLGEPGFYARLRSDPDVRLLVASAVQRLAADDFMSTDAEISGTLELFGYLTDVHPADRVGHSRRVANLAALLAMALDLGEDATAQLRWAALTHDIGLRGVPKTLLDKPSMLTCDEMVRVHNEVARGAALLRPVSGMEDVVRIVAASGERFDGTGYPEGLEGYAIPIGARILAVCDTFDALTSRRPYREARARDLAIDILLKSSGSAFDPDIVKTAIQAFLLAGANDEAVDAG